MGIPTSLILSTVEKEILEIQSAVIYYNSTLVPDLAASPIPSETITIPMDIWLQKSPKVLQHIIVTIVACHRLACVGSAHGVPPGGGSEGEGDMGQLADALNRHRGRGLMQLQRLLSDFWHGDGDGNSRPLGNGQGRARGLVTLVAVVMLLAQEVQMSATSLWSMHLEAARALVVQLGGISNLWSEIPLHRGLFTLYVMIDVMSPPTSPAWCINKAQQGGYLDKIHRLEESERRLIASFQPCPLEVLLAVVRTNVLRPAMYQYQASIINVGAAGMDSLRPLPDPVDLSQTLSLTLASLLNFSPSDWANKVCTTYLSLPYPQPTDSPEQASWTTLATAYQGAAILYLLRSVQHTTFAQALDQDIQSVLDEQRTRLSGALTWLCRDMSKVKAGGLWRFLSWPLFVHAYELTAWTPLPSSFTHPSSPEHGGALVFSGAEQQPPKSAAAALWRLRRVAKRLGANSLFDGAELIERVWQRRCEGAAFGLGDREWRWDDGFDERCVFIV